MQSSEQSSACSDKRQSVKLASCLIQYRKDLRNAKVTRSGDEHLDSVWETFWSRHSLSKASTVAIGAATPTPSTHWEHNQSPGTSSTSETMSQSQGNLDRAAADSSGTLESQANAQPSPLNDEKAQQRQRVFDKLKQVS